ncbi:MAG: toprim domain-containing protein, partial [Patescibacteria group bacterium]
TAPSLEELIIALDQNLEGEATARHILKHLPNKGITVSRLARGLPTGGDIEFADALTLGAAFEGRKVLETARD